MGAESPTPANEPRDSATAGPRGLSYWFITHPIATTLMTAAALLLGIFSFPSLPVAPLPEADFPTLNVSASLPGASPETMASAVATPLEVAFTGIPGITEMTSTSSLGRTSISIQFTLDRDIDGAAQEVQAAINSVAGRLPRDLPNLPTWRKVNPTDAPVLILSVYSAEMPITALSDLVDTRLARAISQIDGVAEVGIMGQQKPAMRVKAQPDRLAAYGLTMADIRAAVQTATVNQPKGAIYGQNSVTTFEANDQIFDPEGYGNIVVAWRNGAPVLVRDVAEVSIGPENAYVGAYPNGRPGVGIVVRRQPGVNIVKIVDKIEEELPALTAQLPASVKVEVLNDRTRTIRASLHEVEITLVVTLVLVVIVMGLFLGSVPATAIVASVLGVAVVATFAAMHLAGFSLNNLTLVALIIAVGFVVDDAIVVVENIHRHIENGETPVRAAINGSREIGFTVVSITFSLIAAFIPLLFMGGIVGRLFREFSITVTMSLLLSLVAALTLAPMLSARFMKPAAHPHGERQEAGFVDRFIAGYGRWLDWALAHQRFMLLFFALTVGATVLAYMAIPKGFFPLQDTAYIQGQTQAAEDISFEEMRRKHVQIADIIAKDPAILRYNHSFGQTGGNSSLARGSLYLVLKDRSDRDVSSEELIARLRPQFAKIPGIMVSLRSSQDINIGVGGGSAQYSYVVKSADPDEMALWAERLTRAMADSPVFRDVRNDLQMGARMQHITIDRQAAARYGLNVQTIDQALYDSYGQRQIGEFQTQENQYRIVLEVDPRFFSHVGALDSMFLRSPSGDMVPLSAVARVDPQSAGPLAIARSGLAPAATISFNLPKGVALGDALAEIARLRSDIGVPATVSGSGQGAAQAFEESLKSQPFLIMAAIVAVYIILGILYESFTTPLTILSTLPSAGLGAVLMLWMFGLDFSIMALIGIILLIGIVKKNGILMVDFALDAQRTRGLSPHDAIREAAVTRFRPIMMTTIAALLAAVPLMLAFGTGAELRQPLGVAVVGGLVISQLLTLFTTPVVYLAIDRLFHRGSVPKEPRARRAIAGAAE